MSVLVDSSIWVSYFREAGHEAYVDRLIEENQIEVNDLILAELLPALQVKRQRKLIILLEEVAKRPMEMDWDDLIQLHVICLRNGINKVGLPDLMIAQHAMRNHLLLYSDDKHFRVLAQHVHLELYPAV